MRTQTLTTGAPRRASASDQMRRLALDLVYPLVADRRLQEQILFYRQFALLIRSGIPTTQALRLREEASTGSWRQVVTDARQNAERGGSLSEVFGRYPETVPPFQTAVIEAGEAAGRLDASLEQIADCLEAEQRLRRFINRHTAYPKVLFVILQFIAPTFFALLAGRNPVNAVAGALLNLVSVVAGFCLVFAVGRAIMTRSPEFALAYETLKWRLPGFGAIARDFAFCRFGRALGALYSSGIPLQRALALSGRASGSRQVEIAALRMVRFVGDGASLGDACRATAFFPPRTEDLLSTGAESGRVDAMMFRMADYLEQEAEDRAHQAGFIVSQGFYLLILLYCSGLFSMAGGALIGASAR